MIPVLKFPRNQCCRIKLLGKSSLFYGFVLLSIMQNETLATPQDHHKELNSCQKKRSCESSGFFERHAEGWHWYDTPPVETAPKEDVLPERKGQTKKEVSPTENIENQRKDLEKKLHAAIVEPNQENIISYILAQKALMDQSQKFSESWKRVVMTNPSLDETLTYPVDQNARQIYYHEKNKEIKDRIKKLAGEYGLFFFFRKECTYCHAFAPVVKNFSKSYGWSVLPISLDGGTLSEFPNAKRNNGIAEKLQITHVPALIALHPKSGKLIPLAYGMTSMSEIEQRVELLTQFQEEMTRSKSK